MCQWGLSTVGEGWQVMVKCSKSGNLGERQREEPCACLEDGHLMNLLLSGCLSQIFFPFGVVSIDCFLKAGHGQKDRR